MEEDLRDWPSDMIPIFAALSRVMEDRHLNPAMLAKLSHEQDAIVLGHIVKITHEAPGELGKRRGRYTIEMRGVRWLDGGRWHFTSGQLEKLARNVQAFDLETSD
jgi:hypothetical protein